MLKYVQTIDKDTGLCHGVSMGNNKRFYMSKRMKKVDVKQSDIDGNWYLTDKCPMKTEDEKEQKRREARIAEIRVQLDEIDKQSQRSSRAISLCILNEEPPNPEDIEKLMDYENKAAVLREELQVLIDDEILF